MTQQQWGSSPTPWGQPPQQGGWPQLGRQPYPQPGPSQSPFGQFPLRQQGYGQLYRQPPAGPFGRSPYGPPGTGPFLPPRRPRRSPLRSLLAAMMILGLIAMASLAFTNSTTESPEVAYQNEDYRVPPPDLSPPPLPVPETYEEAEQLLVDNPFYRQTTPAPVRCDAQPVNVATADDDQLKAHFESLMECLVRVFETPVQAAGFQVVRPTVTIYGNTITTKCGDAEVNAFYCSGDQQVYFSNRLANYVPIVKREKWAADVVMAHEFGHALQARTAILISSNALGQESGDQGTELELSRRLEVQADCLAGIFMRATQESFQLQQSDIQGIRATFNAVGDDVVSGKPNVVGNHGLGRSRTYWGTVGLENSEVGSCNTFTADRKLVR